jgi:hypothetical protein
MIMEAALPDRADGREPAPHGPRAARLDAPDLVRRAFSGSAVKLVQRALDDDSATAEELDAIAKMIAQAKAKKRQA